MATTLEQRMRARSHPLYSIYLLCIFVPILLVSLTYGFLIVFNPTFYIHNFYVPALNKFINSNSTSTSDNTKIIFFDIEIENSMMYAGIRYDNLKLTFSYGTTPLGTYTVPGFYQGMNYKKAQRREVVALTTTLPAEISTAEFRVDLETHIKFKNCFWYFKDKKVRAWGKVEVDDSGKKVGREYVEVVSVEPPPSTLQLCLWIFGFIILIPFSIFVPCFVVTELYHILYPRTVSLS